MTEIIYSHAVMLGMSVFFISFFNNFHSMHAQEQEQEQQQKLKKVPEHLRAPS